MIDFEYFPVFFFLFEDILFTLFLSYDSDFFFVGFSSLGCFFVFLLSIFLFKSDGGRNLDFLFPSLCASPPMKCELTSRIIRLNFQFPIMDNTKCEEKKSDLNQYNSISVRIFPFNYSNHREIKFSKPFQTFSNISPKN